MTAARDAARSGRPLRVGTRRSALARAQAAAVVDGLAGLGVAAELVPISTRGDTDRGSLSRIGGTGVFVGALREALLAGDVDLAVHSLKDLPTPPAAGIVTLAVPPREDARDVLVARDGLDLDGLPPGARVGTGSPRRAAQLRMLRPDLKVADIRGNVDTRLQLVAAGELDAVVLAAAGLARLGRAAEATAAFDVEQMVPAPGQGALAVECAGDPAESVAAESVAGESVAGALARVRALDDPATRAAVTAERAVLAGMQAGCATPVGAFAEIVGGAAGDLPEPAPRARLRLRAVAVAVDGSAHVSLSTSGSPDEAEGLGRALAADLLAGGASSLIEEPLQ